MKSIKLAGIISAIKKFKKSYKGKLALQIMFIKENEKHAGELARLAKEIAPDEVQINTPLRPCAVKPLSKDKINKIKKQFKGLNVVTVYGKKRKIVKPISKEETLKRRGKV